MSEHRVRIGKVRPKNVHHLGVWTTRNVPPDRVLQCALDERMQTAIVLGYDADGEEYFASSTTDATRILWLMRRLEWILMRNASEAARTPKPAHDARVLPFPTRE